MYLTKPSKVQKLESLGVVLTGEEKVAELDELLQKFDPDFAANNPPEPGTTISEIEENQAVANKVQKDNGDRTEVVVRYINPELGLTDRIFSLADHGENFITLAEQFSQKFNGTIDPE